MGWEWHTDCTTVERFAGSMRRGPISASFCVSEAMLYGLGKGRGSKSFVFLFSFVLALVYFAFVYPVMYGDFEPVPEAGVR